MRSTPLNAIPRQHRASLGTCGLILLAALGCASSRGADDVDAQPAGQRAVEADEPDEVEAANLLEDYFHAIGERDYRRAYDYWQPDRSVNSGLTFDQFQQRFSNVTAAEADVGNPHYPKRPLIGAQNIIFPVKVRFTHADGSQECIEGTYWVTKPVVPGAKWMIASSDLKKC